MKRLLATAATAALLAGPAAAELVFAGLDYRTGPYAPGGIPFADGYADYLTMLQERDGGIGGEPIRYLTCETAYNTEQGVECYESTKGEGVLVYQPLSTGITYQLIPKATADDIPLHTMGYGRTSAADGTVFSHVFNFPGTYWDAASVMINHVADVEGGFDALDGMEIALVYHNSAYGKEPIRTLETLAGKHGFDLSLLPVDHPGQEQKATWLQIRRDQPDYVLMWGWGVMNQVALQEAASIRYPMENFIGNWWAASEHDVSPVGEAAAGYKALTFHAVGDDFPVYDDLRAHVVDKGLAAGDGSNLGTVLYNRGMVAAMWAAEAARTAQRIYGVSEITSGMMRDGYEALSVDEARLEELGMAGLTVPVAVSCENHGGPGLGAIQQWDGSEWSLITDYMPADREVVDALIAEDSLAYAQEAGITPRECEGS